MSILHNFIRNIQIHALIEEAVLKKRSAVNLKDYDLEKLPDELFSCRDLRHLFLHHNKLIILDSRIEKLSTLTTLTLDFNRLKILPKALSKLVELKNLNLNHNPLKSLFPEIGKLKRLEILWCNNIEISDLPQEFSMLALLDTLGLRGNQLTKVPDCLLNLKFLRWLTLENNFIKEIPEDIDRLESIVHLNFERNEIQSIPIAITRCKDLRFLFLCFNQIRSLPSSDDKFDLNGMKSLVYIDVRNNPIIDESNIEEYLKEHKRLRTTDSWPVADKYIMSEDTNSLASSDEAPVPAEQPHDALNRDSAESEASGSSSDDDWEYSIASSELNYTDDLSYDEDRADGQVIELTLPEISRFATNGN